MDCLWKIENFSGAQLADFLVAQAMKFITITAR